MATVKTKKRNLHSKDAVKRAKVLRAHVENEGAASLTRTLKALRNIRSGKLPPLEIVRGPNLEEAMPGPVTQGGLVFPGRPILNRLTNIPCMRSSPFERGDNFDRSRRNPVRETLPGNVVLLHFNHYLLELPKTLINQPAYRNFRGGAMAQHILANSDIKGGISVGLPDWMAGKTIGVILSNCSRIIAAAPPFQRVEIFTDVQVEGISRVRTRTPDQATGFAYTNLTLFLEAYSIDGRIRTLDTKVISRVAGVEGPFGGDQVFSEPVSQTVSLTATVSEAEARSFDEVFIRAETTAGVTRDSNLEASLTMLTYSMTDGTYVPGIIVPEILFDFCA